MEINRSPKSDAVGHKATKAADTDKVMNALLSTPRPAVVLADDSRDVIYNDDDGSLATATEDSHLDLCRQRLKDHRDYPTATITVEESLARLRTIL